MALSLLLPASSLTCDAPRPGVEAHVLPIRAALGRDSSATGYQLKRAVGINVVGAPPTRPELDALHGDGMGAIVWLGAYNRRGAAPCEFERDDDWIRERIPDVAGHPAIVAYQITDEPDTSIGRCPIVVDQIRDRATLINELDPSKPTYVTVSKRGFRYEQWSNVVDILGLVVYPVSVRGYDASMIPQAIAQAEADGVQRFWAVVQDFSTPAWYVIPTAMELRRQFQQWATSPAEGYVLYHWAKGRVETRPGHLEVLRDVNGVT